MATQEGQTAAVPEEPEGGARGVMAAAVEPEGELRLPGACVKTWHPAAIRMVTAAGAAATWRVSTTAVWTPAPPQAVLEREDRVMVEAALALAAALSPAAAPQPLDAACSALTTAAAAPWCCPPPAGPMPAELGAFSIPAALQTLARVLGRRSPAEDRVARAAAHREALEAVRNAAKATALLACCDAHAQGALHVARWGQGRALRDVLCRPALLPAAVLGALRAAVRRGHTHLLVLAGTGEGVTTLLHGVEAGAAAAEPALYVTPSTAAFDNKVRRDQGGGAKARVREEAEEKVRWGADEEESGSDDTSGASEGPCGDVGSDESAPLLHDDAEEADEEDREARSAQLASFSGEYSTDSDSCGGGGAAPASAAAAAAPAAYVLFARSNVASVRAVQTAQFTYTLRVFNSPNAVSAPGAAFLAQYFPEVPVPRDVECLYVHDMAEHGEWCTDTLRDAAERVEEGASEWPRAWLPHAPEQPPAGTAGTQQQQQGQRPPPPLPLAGGASAGVQQRSACGGPATPCQALSTPVPGAPALAQPVGPAPPAHGVGGVPGYPPATNLPAPTPQAGQPGPVYAWPPQIFVAPGTAGQPIR